jgi:hypothetical protein
VNKSTTLVSLLVAIGIVLLGAMSWMTVTGIDLAHRYEQSQHEARISQQISAGLWRMDAMLAPIVAGQAAKPTETVFDLAQDSTAIEQSPYILSYFHWDQPESNDEQDRGLALSESYRFIFASVRWNELVSLLPTEQLPTAQTSDDFRMNKLGNANGYVDSNTVVQTPILNSDSQSSNDINRRSSIYQNSAAAQYQAVQSVQLGNAMRNRLSASIEPLGWNPGIIKPIWIGEQLVLARRIQNPGSNSQTKQVSQPPTVALNAIQGCILNWPVLQQDLLGEVADILPNVYLHPRDSKDVLPQRDLAGIPVRLVVPDSIAPFRWSPPLLAMLIVWIAAATAFATIAILSIGLFRLSEKRASFVSAVTHELRTPLTTFRMYSEMLAKEMVAPEDRPHLFAIGTQRCSS